MRASATAAIPPATNEISSPAGTYPSPNACPTRSASGKPGKNASIGAAGPVTGSPS